MSSAFTWNKGGTGALVTLDGERITVTSSIPSAPGSRPLLPLKPPMRIVG